MIYTCAKPKNLKMIPCLLLSLGASLLQAVESPECDQSGIVQGGASYLKSKQSAREGAFFEERFLSKGVMSIDDACILAYEAALCFQDQPDDSCSGTGEYHVIAWKNWEYNPVDQTIRTPETLKVAIGKRYRGFEEVGAVNYDDLEKGYDCEGFPKHLNASGGSYVVKSECSFYYAELEGDAARDAFFDIEFGLGSCGFAANIVAVQDGERIDEFGRRVPFYTGDGALDFDQSMILDPATAQFIKRSWRVSEPTFRLNRGKTAEIFDVNASHLDQDFDGYYRGSTGYVAPWGSCHIRKYFDEATQSWQNTGLAEQSYRDELKEPSKFRPIPQL